MKALWNSDALVLFSAASWQKLLTVIYILFCFILFCFPLEYSVFQKAKSYFNLLLFNIKNKGDSEVTIHNHILHWDCTLKIVIEMFKRSLFWFYICEK